MKIRIRDKITLIMVILILMSVTTLGILSYNNAKNIVIQELKTHNFKTLENVNDYFWQNFMYNTEYVINFWADYPDIKNYRNKPNQPKMVTSIPDHFKPIYDKWVGFIYSHTDIAWIYLGTEEDGSLFVTPLDPTMPEDYDCRTREWYQRAVQQEGKIAWSEPYIDAGASGETIVTVAKAVKTADRLVGVVGMDIKLHKFSDIIKNIQFGENGYLMLLSKNGDVYAHPDSNLLTTNLRQEPWVSKVLSDNTGTNIYSWEGNEVIVSHLTISGPEWKLVGIMPINIDQAIAPIRNKTLSVGIISSLITFIVGYFLSQVATKPVRNIMRTIQEISAGNFHVKTKIETRDEFKILGEKFNEMVDKINELLAERDIHVQALTEKNLEILAQKEEILAFSEETEAMNEELSNLLDEIRENYLSTVRALANAIEASDKYTRGHCDRVTKLALEIGKALDLCHTDMLNLEFAGILHDIGKIGIPSSILNKEGQLESQEYELIQQHPLIGYNILKEVPFLSASRDIVLQHHERVDGTGYPDGLRSDEIHINAKILAIADAYDAMTSARPYRKEPLSREDAFAQLTLGKGTQFDSEITDVFIQLLNSSDFI